MYNDEGRSREGAWIEIPEDEELVKGYTWVAPVRERGLKYLSCRTKIDVRRVAPVRERGLKL